MILLIYKSYVFSVRCAFLLKKFCYQLFKSIVMAVCFSLELRSYDKGEFEDSLLHQLPLYARTLAGFELDAIHSRKLLAVVAHQMRLLFAMYAGARTHSIELSECSATVIYSKLVQFTAIITMHRVPEIQLVECRKCMQKLAVIDALYHHSGMGPRCEKCVDDDDENDGAWV